MKKIKFNLLAIIGMIVAVGTVAFTAPRESNVTDGYNWYEADEATGVISPTPIDASATCIGDQELCAVGLSRDHFGLLPNDESPLNNMNELTEEDEAFKKEVEKD